MSKSNTLFSAFDPVTKKEWQEKISKDLKGKPLEDLQWHLEENITLDAFYHAEDIAEKRPPIIGQRASNDWEIGEDIKVRVVKEANRKALYALEQGVEAPRFILSQAYTELDLKNLLHDIELDMISTHFCENFEPDGSKPVDLLKELLDVVTKRGHDSDQIKGSYNWCAEQLTQPELLEEVLRFALEHFASFRVLTINAQKHFAAPEATSTELAQTIAEANHWLTTFAAKGINKTAINSQLQFSVAIGTSYFVEIAKLRALRLLWANVLKAHGVTQTSLPPIEVHFAPASQTDNKYDNMIRATTQALSAVVGGADRLTVLPANATQEEPTDFTKRIARNVQHLLKLEAYTNRVLDPAAGSYYVEQLTEKLAEEAWGKFQELAG